MIVRITPGNPRMVQVRVYLNDESVHGAVFADDENGVIYRLKSFGDPQPSAPGVYLSPYRKNPDTDDFEMEMLTGNVKIVLPAREC